MEFLIFSKNWRVDWQYFLFSVWSAGTERAVPCLLCSSLCWRCLLKVLFPVLPVKMHKMELCPQKDGSKWLGQMKAEHYHLCAKMNLFHYSFFQQHSSRLLGFRWLHYFIIRWLPFHSAAMCCLSSHMERSRCTRQKDLQRDQTLTLLLMVRASQGVHLPGIGPCS